MDLMFIVVVFRAIYACFCLLRLHARN